MYTFAETAGTANIFSPFSLSRRLLQSRARVAHFYILMKGPQLRAAFFALASVLKYRALITAAETREMHHSRPARKGKIDSPASTLSGEKAFFKAWVCCCVFFFEAN
jgi:hypothetical protein